MHALRAPREQLRRLAWFTATGLLGGGCDLHTKAWAEHTLAGRPGMSMAVIDPWLELSLSYNRGTAFSVIRDLGAGRWVLGVVALAVVVALVVILVRTRADRVDALALGAIAGGALGNGIDRVFRLAPGGGTGVVDFVKLNYPWGGSWPVFNVADVLVACGVIVLLLRRALDRSTHPPATAPSSG
ncbi:MAG: signal peptidase II [Deltaproteobacteria bacterium]|nr:signal peptidase II [Nannocystaceae bacterium]